MSDKITLAYFQKSLAADLERVDLEMQRILASDVRLVDKVVRYIVKRKGKSLRPILTLLCARCFGAVNELAIKVAVITELLHTATLVHDDVVDDAPLRRGFPSINAIWKNKVAVLVGDYLLAKALTEMLELRNLTVLDVFSLTARRMSRGELLQLVKARKLDITEEVYLDMISDKTAALFSACSELAAVTTGVDDDLRAGMRGFGEKLGCAFQIRDDVLDFEGKSHWIGKPTLGDVKEKKITLPLIYALRRGNDKESKRILKLIEHGIKPKDHASVLDYVQRQGGIVYATSTAMNLKNAALAALSILPVTAERQALQEFAEFAVCRSK